MQIVENKVLVVSTKQPHLITEAISKSKVINRDKDDYEVAVHWGLAEAQALTALKFPAPSPMGRDYQWTGKLKPFSHQKDTANFLTLNRKALCLSQAGTGKTASVIWAADYLMKLGKVKRVLVVCPLSIMKSAWQEDLFKFAMHRSCAVAHGSAATRSKIIKSGAEFVIINYDGLEVVKQEIIDGGFDLVVADECFVAGTPVHTPSGVRAIETLQAGEEVFTSAGVQRIKRAMSHKATDLVEVKFSNGVSITCTGDHPFFTEDGWVSAKNATGLFVFSRSGVQKLRGDVPDAPVQVGVAPETGDQRRELLLEILRSEEVAPGQSGPTSVYSREQKVVDTSGSAGLYAHGSQPEANIRHLEGEGAQAVGQGRQRGGHDEARSAGSPAPYGGLGMELPSSVGRTAARLSLQLQAGLRGPGTESGAGSGRGHPHLVPWETTRQEKDGPAGGAWVESVSYNEHGGSTSVYNLDVEGTPNYFVGPEGVGLLVHNCTALKNPMTRRWKMFRAVSANSPWLWLLTGTPAAQSPVDAFGLAKLVNPSMASMYFGQFRDKVMYKLSQFTWAPRPDAKEIVHDALQPAIRFEKKDCLDLPEVMHVDRHVPLTAQQKKYYDALRTSMRVSAAGETITAVNAAVKLNKLLQISCGSVYDDTSGVIEFDVSNRINVVLEVIEEASNKVLIFVPFTHTIELLQKTLDKHKITNAVLSGNVSLNKRSEAVKAFQETPDPRVLIIQPQAAAHGLTLTAADTIIWYAPVVSVETYLQANARINRPGQKNAMTIVHIRGSDVEAKLYHMLQSNIDNHQKIIDLYRQVIANTP